MNKKLYDLMNWPEIEGVVYSDTKHPKKLLGGHMTSKGFLIQAFRPGAVKAFVKDTLTGEIHAMDMADEEGYFAVLIKSKTEIFYTLIYEFKDKTREETVDLYNYPSMIPQKALKSFNAGTNYKAYDILGAHIKKVGKVKGVLFAVWAPNALRVSVVGDFNDWDGRRHQMELIEGTGVYELFIPDMKPMDNYKYEIRIKGGNVVLKADPYAYAGELRPSNASIVYDIKNYRWNDDEWMAKRDADKDKKKPVSIYEMHAGSFKTPDDGREFYNYRELAPLVIDYVRKMQYTHIELMPVMEYPFDGSWGYQVTGYYAPTARYGTPDDFKFFMDEMHKAGIGVILDWVPAHFPKDAFGLARFDGTCLYEHLDPRQGEHPEWGTKVFNYAKSEVKGFLITNALYWIKEFHVDGLRVDAVASMLYLDYGRKDGEWVQNRYGGNKNLDAIEFFKHFNSVIRGTYPGIMTIAEESTAWPNVTGKIGSDSLGFTFKWNMGWMHDFCEYMKLDPYFRKNDHHALTFAMSYNDAEDYILPLSHDEVVHLKCSMVNKMPGYKVDKYANLRVGYTYMLGHSGKKLLFMGQEFGQEREWSEARELDWFLLQNELNQGLQDYVAELLKLYRKYPCLYEIDNSWDGFEWINADDADRSTYSFIRKTSGEKTKRLLFVLNMTPVERKDYCVGVPEKKKYKLVLNSAEKRFGGSGEELKTDYTATAEPSDYKPYRITFDLPAYGALVFAF